MKDWTSWGLKLREFPDYNYKAIWCNLKTIRLGTGVAKELPADKAEFYDVGINTKCNAMCKFCYVSANNNGINYPNICNTWKKWMSSYNEITKNNMLYTDKPFQIAIGSTGEPTIHPEFCQFLETVFNTGVVPNYTTNGITIAKDDELSKQILEATRKFVGRISLPVIPFLLIRRVQNVNFMLTGEPKL